MSKPRAGNERRRTGRVLRGAAAENLMRSGRDELSATRRGAIYVDGSHPAEDRPRPLPERSSPARDALAEQVRRLKSAGATHLEVAIALGLASGNVGMLCREYGIPSVRKAQGGHRGNRDSGEP